MGLNDFEFRVRGVPRLHTDRHAWLMYGLVRWLRPEICVEIGAWRGFSSAHIARGDHSLSGCLEDCNRAIALGARCVCIHDTVGWWGPRDYMTLFRDAKGAQWDCLEANHDSGFAVLLRREPKPPCLYTEADYPTGRIES